MRGEPDHYGGKRLCLCLFLVVLVIGGLWLACALSPVPAQTPARAPASPPSKAAAATPSGSSTSGLGPSIGISYQVQPKIMDAYYDIYAYPSTAVLHTDTVRVPYTRADDGAESDWHWSFATTTTYTFCFWFYLASPYTSVTSVSYDIQYVAYGTTITSDDSFLSIYRAGSYDEVAFPARNTQYTGTLALSSANVVNGRIYGRLYVTVSGTGLTDVDFYIDQLAFNYNPVTETRRSTYDVLGGTLRYAIDWDCWDYAVTTTLTVPSAWTYQNVNPTCAQASNVFSCLVPMTYEAIYSAPVTATANWAAVFSDSFETGCNSFFWDAAPTGAVPDSVKSEYVRVADGAASLNITKASNVGDIRLKGANLNFVAGYYAFILSWYLQSGTFYFYWYDGGWQYVSNTTTGRWITAAFVKHVSDWSLNNPILRVGSGVLYVDGFTVYNSSVSIGYPITGSCVQVHANGASPASFFKFNYNCTTLLWVNTAKVTDANGTWTILPTFATAAGTYTFYTTNPSAMSGYTKDTLTVPFTRGSLITMTFCFRQADSTPIAWPTPWKIYVQGSRLGSVLQYTTALFTVNLTIVDMWGTQVYQNTTLYVGAYVDLLMPVYYLILQNQRDYPQDLKITHGSVDYWVYGIGAHDSSPYLVSNTVTYTAFWYKPGDHITPTDPPYTFTVTGAPVAVSSGIDYPVTLPGGQNVVVDFGGLMGWIVCVVVIIVAVLAVWRKGKTHMPEAPPEPERRYLNPHEKAVAENAPAFQRYESSVRQNQRRGGESTE